LGCELETEYNEWAMDRLDNVRLMSVEDWIEHDRKTAERRESIR
jgi:site-specific DNA-methyltransferase (adenine-specific)